MMPMRRLTDAKSDKAVSLRRRVGEYIVLGLQTWDPSTCVAVGFGLFIFCLFFFVLFFAVCNTETQKHTQ
jgi:hypothetical protein